MAKTSVPKDFNTFSSTSVPDYDSFITNKNYYRVNGNKREGGQSYIFPCTDNKEKSYVVKVYKKDTTPSPPQLKLAETISSKRLSHILPVIDSGKTKDKALTFQIMPYMWPIMEYRIDSIEVLIRIISDLVIALNELHNAGVLHRDITPYNCFVAKDGAYIGDLGSITLIDVSIPELNQGIHMTQRLHAGTRGYTAPEVFFGIADNKSIHSTASDWYSLGGTLASIISRQDIFEDISESQYYSMLAEGQIPIYFPEYINDKYKTAIRNLINGLTSADLKTRWDSKKVSQWLKNPLNFSSDTTARSNKVQYTFNPAVYFDGHMYKKGDDLANAMIKSHASALKFIKWSDFSSIMASASVSLADSVVKLMVDATNSDNALLSKIIKLLNPCGAFLSYKGTAYSSPADLVSADNEILQEILSSGLVSFCIKHTSNMTADEKTMSEILSYESYSMHQPDTYRFNTTAFKLFIQEDRETTNITPCFVISQLCRNPELIMNHISNIREIKDDTCVFLSYLYYKGYRKQTQELLDKLLSTDKKYVKAHAICIFFEEIINCAVNDNYFNDAQELYLAYLKKYGPDAWIPTFVRKCTEKYKPLDDMSARLLQKLAAYHIKLINVRDFSSWNKWIIAFYKDYAEFKRIFQSDIQLSISGIRAGKSIFSYDESGFFFPTRFEQLDVPNFCQ